MNILNASARQDDGTRCAMLLPDIEEALFRIDASDFTNATATWLPMSGQTMLKSSDELKVLNTTEVRPPNVDEDYIEWDLNIGPTANANINPRC